MLQINWIWNANCQQPKSRSPLIGLHHARNTGSNHEDEECRSVLNDEIGGIDSCVRHTNADKMNDHLSDTTCNTETLLKHQTRQAILDASDQVSIGLQSRVNQPGSKKRRFTDSPSEETSSTDPSNEQPTTSSDSECAKRVCLDNDEPYRQNETHIWKPELVEYWVAVDLVTAGRQGSDQGRDQAPIVQFILALGHFKSKTVKDRLLVNVYSTSYINQVSCTAETQSTNGDDPKSITHPSTLTTHPKMNFIRNPNSPVQLLEEHESQSKDFPLLNGSVPLTTEAAECVTRNCQSNIQRAASTSFEDALDKIEKWITSQGVQIGDSPTDSSVILITDGHKAPRNVLHPEAAYRGLDHERLGRSPWGSYVDLISWCKQAPSFDSNPRTSISTLADVTEALQLNLDSCSNTGSALTKLDQMVAVIQKMIEINIPLCEPQIIRNQYEHRVFSKNISLKDSQVVEVRQVPWSATPSIIAGFFAGLNIIPGGVAIRLTDGRRSNTAIVAFSSVLNAQLALVRHQHQLCGALLPETLSESADKPTGRDQLTQPTATSKPVMLQVYSATSREFIQCAGCDQSAVVDFLSQLTNGEQVVVRVRGLPYTVTKKQIAFYRSPIYYHHYYSEGHTGKLDFFLAVQATVLFDCQGIYLVAYPDRRPTGDAFVLFPDDKTATKALVRHKDYLGDRYVELFKASPSEMVQVCHNVSQQTHNSNKVQNNLLDAQARSRTNVNPLTLNTMLSTIAPYLTREQQIALALKNLRPGLSITPLQNVPIGARVLPSSVFSAGDIHSAITDTHLPETTLDQLTMINSLGVNQTGLTPFTFSLPRHVPALTTLSPVSPTLSGLRVKPAKEPVIKDPTDPTDPDCTFARPWPEQGVTAVLELSSLPLETSRHDVRLYLGPANYSKVYRMLRKEMAENQTTSTWLLSLIDTTTAVHLVRDLVNRTFSLGTMTGLSSQVKVFPNVPTFTLYHVGPEKQLELIPLEDPSFGIPFNRIHIIPGTLEQPCKPQSLQPVLRKTQNQQQQRQQQQQQQPLPTTHSSMPTASFLTRHDGNLQAAMANLASNPLVANSTNSVPTDPIYNQLLQALAFQTPMPIIKSPGCQMGASGAMTTATGLPVSIASLNNPSTQMLSSTGNSLLPIPTAPLCSLSDLTAFVNNAMAHNCPSSSSSVNACLVMITGAPSDATTEELRSLFHSIGHLLSTPPRFSLHQNHPNGTANFLALFNSPLEAQAAALYCPSGTLRNNQYTVGTACLVPPGAFLDINGTVQCNTSGPNLVFNPLTMTNSNLFFN
nr:unnamed protein product [Fasciola hepatica]